MNSHKNARLTALDRAERVRRALAWHRSNSVNKKLEAIPGIGPLITTALVASLPDPGAFH